MPSTGEPTRASRSGQTVKENYVPELFVAPNATMRQSAVAAAVRARIERLQGTYPGVGCETAGDELHITIPDRYRVGHEAHFAQVVAEFLKYLKSPQSMPAWERPQYAGEILRYHHGRANESFPLVRGSTIRGGAYIASYVCPLGPTARETP